MRKGQRVCLACFENGEAQDKHHDAECRAYAAQVQWNRKMARLLEREPEAAPLPAAPDYSTTEAVTDRCRERGTLDTVAQDIYRLLDGDGRTYRLFRKALGRAA